MSRHTPDPDINDRIGPAIQRYAEAKNELDQLTCEQHRWLYDGAWQFTTDSYGLDVCFRGLTCDHCRAASIIGPLYVVDNDGMTYELSTEPPTEQ